MGVPKEAIEFDMFADADMSNINIFPILMKKGFVWALVN